MPTLNDPVKLTRLDDNWYADTIAAERPAQGMPTWERGETIEPPCPVAHPTEVLHMLEHKNLHAVEHVLEEAAQTAMGDMLAVIHEPIAALEVGNLAAVEEAIHHAAELMEMEEEADEDSGGHCH